MTDTFVDEFVTDDHAKTVCKIGHGAECCRYLTMSPKGWSCERMTPLRRLIDKRVADNQFNARGINCGGRKPRQ